MVQTFKDMSVLGSQLVLNSNEILVSKVRIFANVLWRNISDVSSQSCFIVFVFLTQVLKNHQYFIGSTINGEEVSALEKLLSGSSLFERIALKYLIPCLECVVKSINDTDALQHLGTAWVLYGTGMIVLYVPDVVFDPAIRQHVEVERLIAESNRQKAQRDAWSDIRKVLFGVDDWYRGAEDILSVEFAQAATYRKQPSQIGALHREWQAAVSSIFGETHIDNILSLKSMNHEAWISQIAMFQTNSSQFLNRMRSNFPTYADITSLVNGYVYSLKFGFDLLTLSDNESNNLEMLSFLDPSYLSGSDSLNLLFETLRPLLPNLSGDISDQILLFLLKTISAQSRSTQSTTQTLSYCLQSFYYKWSLQRLRSEEEEVEASKTFTYKNSEPSEEEAEEEFKRMFPDYEEAGISIEDDSNKQQKDPANLAADLMSVYKDLFLGKTSTDELLSSTIYKGYELIKKIKHSSDIEPTTGLIVPSILSSLILCMSNSVHNESESPEKFNFYFDSNKNQTSLVVSIVSRIRLRILSLLDLWPEHSTLQNLDFACNELLHYSLNTPIARFLQKVEQIYGFLQEWESYASSKHSVKMEFDELTSLIISWRKLELSTWPTLFEHEDNNAVNDLGKWWYYLYENIIVNPERIAEEDNPFDLSELVQLLTVFISESTIGQFSARLELVQSFANHAKMLSQNQPSMNEVSSCVENVITMFSQYKSDISARLASGKKSLAKQIQEVILLASWKDTNISALKQSARRSHHKLHNIIRKYRQVISEKVTNMVSVAPTGEISESSDSLQFEKRKVQPEHALDSSVSVKIIEKITSWTDRPQRLRSIDSTIARMRQIQPNLPYSEGPFHILVQSILEEMKRLKKETPTVLNEETKKVVSGLRMEKSKMLSDTIKELRRSGLNTSVKINITKAQAKISDLLKNTPSFGVSTQYDRYLFRILEMLSRMRSTVSDSQADVPLADLHRGLSIAENLLNQILRQRKLMHTVWSQNQHFEQLMACTQGLSEMAQNENDHLSDSHQFDQRFSHASKMLVQMPKVLEFCNEVLNASSAFSSDSKDSELSRLFDSQISIFKDLSIRLSKLENLTSQKIMTSVTYAVISDILQQVVEIQTLLISWKQKSSSNVSFIADVALNWIAQQHLPAVTDSPIEGTSISSLDSALRDICDSILVVFQKIKDVNDEEEDESSDDWFVTRQARHAKLASLLHYKLMCDKLDKILEMIRNLDIRVVANPSENDQAISLIAVSVPFINEYHLLAQNILSGILADFSENTKSGYHLYSCLYNLALHGFCSPQEPSDDQNQKDSQAVSDGTGLGDGSGANNNSKDIEDDEDLSEIAQQENKEQESDDELDKEEDSDAVDIEGDMAGKLEDAPEQEDDDEKDESDGEEEDELDEEVGDIDDLDPNAVDEKMWDEKGDDDLKDKKSDTLPQNSVEDEDMTAMEESNEKEENREGNEQDGQDEESSGNEEDVGEQEDNVVPSEAQELEQHVEETETLELPQDMELDADEEEEAGEENMDEPEDIEESEEIDDGNQDEMSLDRGDEEAEVEREGDQQEDENEPTLPEEVNLDNHEESVEESVEENVEDNEVKTEKEPLSDSQAKTDGLHGQEESEDANNEDDQTAVKQESGSKGDGIEEEAEEENSNVGAGGEMGVDSEENEEKNDEDKTVEDPAVKATEESMKQLGDALKEFHKRMQEIKQSSEYDESSTDSANQRPDEFQHVEGEESSFDTQALGSASKDQARQQIDDSMAIEDEEQNRENSTDPEIREIENDLDDIHVDNDDQDNGSTEMSKVGDRHQTSESDMMVVDGEEEQDRGNKDEEQDEDMSHDSNDDTILSLSSDLPPRDIDEARHLWDQSEVVTRDSSLILCEQLRLILEPTRATKLRGDFKTGKRLNMKRIIPYIASDFKKDKIWMRRTKPSKRDYQIMIAVDDSKSMSESRSVNLAFQSIALISKALTQLEAGQLSIVRFGEYAQMVHPFNRPFTGDAGAKVLQWFGFEQQKTDVSKLLEKSIDLFNEAGVESSKKDVWRLELIISDGICEDHDTLRRLVRKAREDKIMMVFVIVDGINQGGSILDMNQVKYESNDLGEMTLKMEKYLDNFPFDFYVIVRDVLELPGVLSLVLRQFFAEIAE